VLRATGGQGTGGQKTGRAWRYWIDPGSEMGTGPGIDLEFGLGP